MGSAYMLRTGRGRVHRALRVGAAVPVTEREKLRPFWTYYGGKWRVAPKYPKPKHSTIIEPFAGAAGYSLRYHWHDVILIDAYEVIAGMWDYLIHVSPQEVMALPDLEEGQSVDDLAVVQEAAWLIGFWLNGGCATPVKTRSAWARNPKYKRNFWGPWTRERIAKQIPHIRHWRIIHGAYDEAPEVEATWFVDPPYQQAGRYYRGHSAIDFPMLGWWCRTRPGQVIVCENDGADWLPFRPFANIQATGGGNNGSGVSKEVVWHTP